MRLGAKTRAPPVRDTRAFRARGWLSFPRSMARALGGFVMFEPSGSEHRLLPSGVRRDRPRDAAGTCQAGVCGDAAGPGGRPARAGLRIKRRRRATRRPPDRSGHSRWQCPCRFHLDPAGTRAGQGVASQASGLQVRPPPSGTHRLPPVRAPWARTIHVAEGAVSMARGSGCVDKMARFARIRQLRHHHADDRDQPVNRGIATRQPVEKK